LAERVWAIAGPVVIVAKPRAADFMKERLESILDMSSLL